MGMVHIEEKISHIRQELSLKAEACTTVKQLEEIQASFLGKKGCIPELLGELKMASLEEKRLVGPMINALRQDAENLMASKKEKLIAMQEAKAQALLHNFDVTLNVEKKHSGHMHPFSHVIEEIENIFISMGYEIWDGPEAETEFYNFTALNVPKDHPARDMQDTFWTDRTHMLLRTHTSTIQVHTMQQKKLPIAGVATGRVFRNEAVDASHDFMFMQCEGMLIDKQVTVSHLLGTAQTFLKALFEKDSLDIRIRPGFFPFVEPGFEIDMRCVFCKNGCSVCKKSTWVEVFPGGMIHPNVLRSCGINPDEYSGFAFGFGLTRLAMLKYGIDDIRHIYGGSVKFLEQF